MYAKSSPGEAYHLVAQDEANTLCGQTVAPIIIDRPVTTSGLHLTSRRPTDRPLCQECARDSKDERQSR